MYMYIYIYIYIHVYICIPTYMYKSSCDKSGNCRCALIGVPWCLRRLSLFSPCLNMSLTNTSPQAKHAKTDLRHGTPTTAHFQPPDYLNAEGNGLLGICANCTVHATNNMNYLSRYANRMLCCFASQGTEGCLMFCLCRVIWCSASCTLSSSSADFQYPFGW